MTISFLRLIDRRFKAHQKGRELALKLLRNGISVRNGELYINDIHQSRRTVADSLGVDSRTLRKVIRDIETDKNLSVLFGLLRVQPSLKEVAIHSNFRLGVLEIKATKASDKDILSKAASVVSRNGLVIRTSIAQDFEIWIDPTLLIVTDGPVTGNISQELLATKGIRSVTLYSPQSSHTKTE